MSIPKMILFDYGQTLVNEAKFDGVKGTGAVLQYATKNKFNYTAEEIQARADAINHELGRFDPKRRHLFQIEVPNAMFSSYLYESLGIELSLSSEEIDRVFWDAAAPGTPTDGIEDFLDFLQSKGIRTGVISNISYCNKVVKERIKEVIPSHEFEFIIATSEYMFRKPNKRIFEFALNKADLKADEVWYIGDQFECDIVGSREAGMTPVWYTGASNVDGIMTEAGEVLSVKNWGQLKEILEDKEK